MCEHGQHHNPGIRIIGVSLTVESLFLNFQASILYQQNEIHTVKFHKVIYLLRLKFHWIECRRVRILKMVCKA